jgi:hypothetical protein
VQLEALVLAVVSLRVESLTVRRLSPPDRNWNWELASIQPGRPARSARLAKGEPSGSVLSVLIVVVLTRRLDGEEMRRLPLAARRECLALSWPMPTQLLGRRDVIFAHACRLGLEGRSARARLIARGGASLG